VTYLILEFVMIDLIIQIQFILLTHLRLGCFCWKNNDRTEKGSLLTQCDGIQYTKQWYSHTFYYQIHTIYIDIIKCLLQSLKYLINIRLFNTYFRFIVFLDS